MYSAFTNRTHEEGKEVGREGYVLCIIMIRGRVYSASLPGSSVRLLGEIVRRRSPVGKTQLQ